MAHLHEWEPGMKSMSLDFDTGNPVTIELEPEKMPSKMPKVFTSAIKLKRARSAVEPPL